MAISIIMPVYNEVENLKKQKVFFSKLFLERNDVELIVVDGGSTDESLNVAASFAQQALLSPKKGRAQQMNYGAALAAHDILYFVHADVTLNNEVFSLIIENVESKPLGGFRFIFDKSNAWLRINERGTHVKGIWAGAGDQTLYISKSNFEELGGYNDSLLIMEDFDIVKRAKKISLDYHIIPHNIIVSARKYNTNSWLRVQITNGIIIIAWKLGASQKWMKDSYRKMLHPF